MKPAPGALIGGSIRLGQVTARALAVATYEAMHARSGPVEVRIFEGDHASTELHYFERGVKVLKKLPVSRFRPRYLGHGLASGHPFVVTDQSVGLPLERMLHGDRAFDEEMSLAIVTHLCEALADLHKLGASHCAIHPRSIRVARDATGGSSPIRITLGEWGHIHDSQGLLQVYDDGDDDLMIDSFIEGNLPGLEPETAEYLAPEQFWAAVSRQASTNRTGPASDVFAIAVLAFRMLTGAAPWPYQGPTNGPNMGRSAVKVYLHERSTAGHQLERPSRIHPALWSILQRALLVEPEQRHADSRELLADLRRYQERGEGARRIPAALFASTTVDPSQPPPTPNRSRIDEPPPVPRRSHVSLADELPDDLLIGFDVDGFESGGFESGGLDSGGLESSGHTDESSAFASAPNPFDLPLSGTPSPFQGLDYDDAVAAALEAQADVERAPAALHPAAPDEPAPGYAPLVATEDGSTIVGESEFPAGLRRNQSSALRVYSRDFARMAGEEWEEPPSESWLERLRDRDDPATRRLMWAVGGFAAGLGLYVLVPFL